MESLALIRRTGLGLAGTGLGIILMAAAAHPSEVDAACVGPGLVIHGSEETLREFCRREDGRLWLVLPDGTRFELVTSTSDPAIANPGDGSFHPFDEQEVRAAVAGLSYPLARVSAELFVLPYPRRYGLESAAGPGLVLLSPGVRPLSPEQQHAELTHELGHVVHYALMPDANLDAWARYRDLRGITDATIFSNQGPHSNRPHEIFAEDFRALFGDRLANYSESIENPLLAMPASVPGLDRFMLALAGQAAAPLAVALHAYPNPSRGAVSFRRDGGEGRPLDLYDLAGRRVATVHPVAAGPGWIWCWDGRDGEGRPVAPGTLFARVREGGAPSLRVTRLR